MGLPKYDALTRKVYDGHKVVYNQMYIPTDHSAYRPIIQQTWINTLQKGIKQKHPVGANSVSVSIL
jgi:hypothetical protein